MSKQKKFTLNCRLAVDFGLKVVDCEILSDFKKGSSSTAKAVELAPLFMVKPPCYQDCGNPEPGSSLGKKASKRKNVIPAEGEDESSGSEESTDEDEWHSSEDEALDGEGEPDRWVFANPQLGSVTYYLLFLLLLH